MEDSGERVFLPPADDFCSPRFDTPTISFHVLLEHEGVKHGFVTGEYCLDLRTEALKRLGMLFDMGFFVSAGEHSRL